VEIMVLKKLKVLSKNLHWTIHQLFAYSFRKPVRLLKFFKTPKWVVILFCENWEPRILWFWIFFENPGLELTTKLKNSPTLVWAIYPVFTAEYWFFNQNLLQKWTHLFATKPYRGDSLSLSSTETLSNPKSLLSVYIMISHFVPFNLTLRIYGHWCICWRPTTLTGSLEPGMPSISLPWATPFLTTLKSSVADYDIFLTTLYITIFRWWSYTCNSDQNVSFNIIFFSEWVNLWPHIYLMSWNDLTLGHCVGCMHGLAHSNGVTSTLPNIEAGAWPFHRQ